VSLKEIEDKLGADQFAFPVRLKIGELEVSLADFELRPSKGQLVLVGARPRVRKGAPLKTIKVTEQSLPSNLNQ
jgi:hypothetical protein